jgi:release factor glutamine methyltransferase
MDLFKLNLKNKFDIIISNPPYLTNSSYAKLDSDIKFYEPKRALVAGVDGLKFYEKIISIASTNLKKNGFLGLEIGDGHYIQIKKLLLANSFKIIDRFKLINGEIRCILATKIR